MKKLFLIPIFLLFLNISAFCQIELIQNGNFSGLGSNWSSGGPYWFISNSFTCYSSATAYAYTGTVSGGGANNTYGSINQAITIPANATNATLTFKTSINTDETTTTTVYDLLEVQLRSPSLALLHTFVQYSNLNGVSPSSGCQAYQTRTFNVPSSYFGQPLLLNFQTASDNSSFTKFRIDDVSLTYQACTLPPAPTGLIATIISSNQINLSWNNVSAAIDYQIYYIQGDCPWAGGNSSLIQTSSNTVQITGLNSNTTYRFIVLARNACGWGTTFNCVSATTSRTCSYSISPSSVSPSSSPGNASIAVTASAGCNWTAVSNNTSWLTVTSGSSGTGNGTVNYSYTTNNTGGPRTGTITAANQTFTVIQAAAGCSYSIAPSSVSPSSSAGSNSFTVTATSGCNWTAVSNNTSWLTVTSGNSGTGNGTVNYSYTTNGSTLRTGTITIANQTFTVTQAGNVPPPTVNSLICTNVILNHPGIEQNFTFYNDNTPYSNNDHIKVCADGSTATYIKVNVSNTTGIGFRVLDENNNPINNIEKYGQLGTVNVFGNNVEVPYTHPQYMDASSSYRSLTLQVTYNDVPISGIAFSLAIYRAPVLMIHGWLGGLSSFETMESSLLQNNYTWPLTYRKVYPNSASFNDNLNVALDGITDLFNRVRSGNISCGSVDILAHSMGGILSRLYLQSNSYKNDIHKLITFNTPHSGTQGANFVYDIGIITCPLLEWIGAESFICSPAVENMRVNSNSVRNQLNGYRLNQHIVPSYAISTQDILAADPDCYSLGVLLYTGAGGLVNFVLLQSIFNFEGSDLVVPISSQQGGLTKFHHFTGQCHLKSIRNSAIVSFTLGLLNASPNGNNFDIDGYNPNTLNSSYRNIYHPTNLNQLLAGNVSIIYPLNGDSFNPGQQIIIQTTGAPSISKTILIAGNDAIPLFSRDTLSSSVSMNYTIPFEASGEVRIACAGYDTVSQSFSIDTIRINITDNALLDSIGTHLDTLRIPLGTHALLPVIAYYQDNTTREVSKTESISFIVADTTVSKNMAKNSFYGQSSGTTMLQINYRNKLKEIPILVYQGQGIVSSIFSSNKRTLCTNDSVTFSDISIGVGLSRQWLFEGGIPSTSTDMNTVVTYPIAGTYKVKLITSFINGIDSLVIDSLIEVKTLNKTITSGNWNNPQTWSCNSIPSASDSAIVGTGHTLAINNSAQVRKLYLESGATLSLNDSTILFTVGTDSNKTSSVICNGNFNIKKGIFKINGNLSMAGSSHFNMTGGKLIIDGNTGHESTSVPDGQHLFNIDPTAGFSFKDGTLQIINPPLGANSQAINCSHNFGLLSTIAFGDGVSTIATNNPNGFGGNLLPSLIGKFVFDPATHGNNRIFRNLNPLIANNDIQILSGDFAPGVLFHAIDSIPSVRDVDGNSYPILTICDQEWMGKNLSVTHYRNGDTIPQVQDPVAWSTLTTGAWCYYQNNTANGPVYGKLYNWYAINDPRGLAPLGWHIPTNAEWFNLSDTCLGSSAVAGGLIKTPGLLSDNTGLWGGNFNNSTNSSGFSGVPAGCCLPTGIFSNLSAAALWWSTTSSTTTNAWYREADQETDDLSASTYSKKLGISVRCVKD